LKERKRTEKKKKKKIDSGYKLLDIQCDDPSHGSEMITVTP
jgi:hypothetical protein